jgi:EAL domain-containing protein (putative c-di-GMP-specific phosphodiesterase class I)
LSKYKIDPNVTEIVISEGALGLGDELKDILNKTRSQGIKLLIDDFGTGYSSLSHLKNFPISAFKIDKSYIHGIPESTRDIAIINAIITLRSNLSVDIITEGVEIASNYKFLKQTGVDSFQDYFFSKPLQWSEISSFVDVFSVLPDTALNSA